MNSFYNESVKNSIDDKRTESDKTKQARTGLQTDIALESKVKGGIPNGLGKDNQ